MAVVYERLQDGRYRVYRDFHSLPAATHAATLLEGVSERAFIPVEPVSFEADPKLQAMIDRADEDAPLEGLTAGKAAPPDLDSPGDFSGDFHVCAQSGAAVVVE